MSTMLTAVSYETYRKFAKKYNIRLTKTVNGVRKKKTFTDFKRQIRKYEKSHNVKGGLYY